MGGCWWGEGRRGEPGWAGFTCREKFSMPSGVQVLDLNQRPSGCHSSRPRAFVRLAQSRSAQGRFRGFGVPARAASGLQGPGECQGLASSSSSSPPSSSFLPSGQSTISCKWREMEQQKAKLLFNSSSLVSGRH